MTASIKGIMPASKNFPAKFEPDNLFKSIPGYRILSSVGPAILLLFILTLTIGSEMFSGHVIGSTHPDNDLGYFLALRNFTFYGSSSLPSWNPYVMCGVPQLHYRDAASWQLSPGAIPPGWKID